MRHDEREPSRLPGRGIADRRIEFDDRRRDHARRTLLDRVLGRKPSSQASLEPEAARDDAEFHKAIETTLNNPLSLVAPSLRAIEPRLTKDVAFYRSALEQMGPDERRNHQQQLVAEVLATCAFHRDYYRQISEGRASTWADLEPTERHIVAHRAEFLTAGIEGRDAVIIASLSGNLHGGFMVKDRRLEIHLGYENTLARGIDLPLIETLAHEQEHVRDYIAMHNPAFAPELSPAEIEELRENAKNYKVDTGRGLEDYLAYRDQVIERRARAAAEDRVNRIYDFWRRNNW